MASKSKTNGKPEAKFDPIAWWNTRKEKKAKKAAVVIEPKADTSTGRYHSPTKKVKDQPKPTRRDRNRNKKIAKGNKSHGHGRK